MPTAAVQLGGAERVLPIGEIAGGIAAALMVRGARAGGNADERE
jgi:hypothetical protein